MSEQAVFEALKYRIEVDKHGCSRYCNAANQLHRDGGPAVVYEDGHVEWWRHDQRHRTDGPAIVWNDGDEWWYNNGRRLYEDEYYQAVKELGE